jgi:hypothetical protein
MRLCAVPQIEDRFVCIATNNQVVLASLLSSYFCEKDVYFPVFEFPSIDTPYSASSDFGKDGYFGRVLGDRAAHKINNALARIQPKVILLLGLTETEQGYLRALLPSKMLTVINGIEEIRRLLPFEQPHDSIACRPSQIIEGLLHAKFSRKSLIVDGSAPLLSPKHLHAGGGILVIENGGNVDDVSAINYAFAVNADVVLVPSIERQEIRDLPRIIDAWSKDNSHHAYNKVKRTISKRLRGIDFPRYSFATFFTRGFPYGFIVDNLVEEHDPMTFDSALLFSPQLFPIEETDEILKILDNNSFTVKALLGKDATVTHLSNYGGFYPFDIMHICAHGGETNGYFVIQQFTDRNGVEHTFEFYEVVGFTPTDGEMVQVMRKAIFKAFDGFPWMSKPLKSFPHYVFEDMIKALKSNRHGVTRKATDYPIALSCHIQCHDSIHQGTFQSLAGYGHPVVFNNTCSSSHELAVSFIHAGARSYIGTLWSIGNDTANLAATAFYRETVQHGNLLSAFDAMNDAIRNKKYQHVYIFWGLHFSSLPKPSRKSDAKLLKALANSYSSLLEKIKTTPDPEVKHNTIPIAKFVAMEIAENFSKEQLDKIRDLAFPAVEDSERTSPAITEDHFSRGITEIEVTSEGRFR